MRPLRFPQAPVNPGLAYGAAAVQGINSGLANFARMRMQANQMEVQRMHMQAVQETAKGMAAYRQAQAENLRREHLGVDMSKANLWIALGKVKGPDGEPIIPPSIAKKYVESHLGSAVANMSPDETSAFTQKAYIMAARGKLPPEMQSEAYTLNPNETKYVQAAQGNETKLGVAGIQGTSRVQSAAIQGQAKTGAAQIYTTGRGTPRDRIDIQTLRNISAERKNLETLKAKLDQPPLPGALGMDEKTKAARRASLQSDLDQLNAHEADIHDRLGKAFQSGGAETPPSPTTPKTLSWDQKDERRPGDTITHPSGVQLRVGPNGGYLPLGGTPAPASGGPGTSVSPPGAVPGADASTPALPMSTMPGAPGGEGLGMGGLESPYGS